MPVHDWTRVDAFVYRCFLGAWNTHLIESLNQGTLPKTCYARAEALPSAGGSPTRTDATTRGT
jgi:hypothetical protein